MPRYNSGTRNVARSLTTATSLHMAICSPPPWHSPLTADTTGFTDWRSVSNGVTSIPSAEPNVSQLSLPSPPPMSPPGAKTSPVPVISRPARSGSASTCRTAYRIPKYIAGVIALRASGRSSVQTPNGPSRVNRRYGVPSQSPSGGRGVLVVGGSVPGPVVVMNDPQSPFGWTQHRRWLPHTVRSRRPPVPAWRAHPQRSHGAGRPRGRPATLRRERRRRRRPHQWYRRAPPAVLVRRSVGRHRDSWHRACLV